MKDKKQKSGNEEENRSGRRVCRYREEAERGDALSQYKLGCCYHHGDGVEKDYVEAVKWYRKAAEQGNMAAQNCLGHCYYSGRGVVQDHAEAAKWYRKAAEQGYARAQFNLGRMYENGQGVEQDFGEAAKWYRKAAEQGHARAQFNLGQMYDNGRGVAQNNAEALEWYRMAAEQGHGEAHDILVQRIRGGVGRNYSRVRSDAVSSAACKLLVACHAFHAFEERICREREERLRREEYARLAEERLRREEYTRLAEERRKREECTRLAEERGRLEVSRHNNLSIRQVAIMEILGSARKVGGFIGSCVANFMVTPFSACVSSLVSLFSKIQRKQKQEVVAAAFAPSQARRNSDLLVSVFLHTLAEAEDVQRLARKMQRDSERRSYKPLACQLNDGDKVDILLNIYGGNKLLSSQVKSIVWRGRYDDSTFRYFISEDINLGEISCEVTLSMNNVPIGEMIFKVEIDANENLTPAEFDSRIYNKIFISYSHEDESKVKYIANAYKLEGKDYFFDRHYLKSGDVYPEEIRKYIDTSDLFILCWSANASRSEYVRKELSQALNLAYPKIQPRGKARLAIRPIIIDPRADPPDEMKGIYNFEEV